MEDLRYRIAMPIRVFIFEDHWMCREALIAVLEKIAGIQIVGASEQVQEGLQECFAIKPEVVLMDILFHGEKQGIQATAAIKEKLPETKIIIFTDFPDEETLHSAVKAGASGFLLKREVQDPDIIVSAIRMVHRGDSYLTPSMTTKILNVVQRLADSNNSFGLTRREREVLRFIAKGADNRSIGKSLGIDERTVANHVSNVLFKMNAKNRTEAAAIASRVGMLDPSRNAN